MITVQEAHALISKAVHVLSAEEISLHVAQGRVIAEDIRADFALPRFDNAAMDGFAVQWADIRDARERRPVTLRVNGEIPAGAPADIVVEPGSCVQIMTGAHMPEGADTVVAYEQTSGFGGETVDIFKPPAANANVRYAGEEVKPGDLLMRKGMRLTPAELGVLAAFGRSHVQVFQRPSIGIVTVGDELREPGQQLDGAAIYNSNRYSLESCALSAGAVVAGSWHAPDQPDAIAEILGEALAKSDLLMTAGGISTGEYDYIQRLLTGLGVRQQFWKVAHKPGKPLFFGDTPEGKLVFGLPGNPVSALVCFLEYIMPALSAMQDGSYHGKIDAVLAEPFPADRKRYRFLFGRVWQKDGGLFCLVSDKTESHMLTSLVGSNCLIEAPAAAEPLPAGSVVTCNLLPWSTLHE
ncbi:MAG: molybdopterin molybdotransferase MoeA [Prosthecochloris sp.]|uniref:molybdopterin molybdotransferase MoeA n=1 Tax=Prosthecochloris sp. TaxID=290513 RepID=UPI00258C88AF|nr:gephyrin-like molybdotransferase Glp [Prosthecochloris sp.]MCW8797383.1 molybdopterin molybdotransferase MoeA [Prosthecochloris sp.]